MGPKVLVLGIIDPCWRMGKIERVDLAMLVNEVHDADLALLVNKKSGAWKVIAGDRHRSAGVGNLFI